MSNVYNIEHIITTLSQCAVMKDKKTPSSFVVEGINFRHLDFNFRDGWLGNSWVAKAKIKSSSYQKAFKIFNKKMLKIIPRISLISQSYIDYNLSSFLIHKEKSEVAFFRSAVDVETVGLMFMEKELKALKILLKNKKIPEEFFFYWNDTVNSVGYASKLLMMFSAVESLSRKRDKNKFKKPQELTDYILGKDLRKKMFDKETGLRNKLIHGEYFNGVNLEENYVEIIHKKIINYFNNEFFNEKLLNDDVVNPQRHFFGSKKESRYFIKKLDNSIFDIEHLINNLNDELRLNSKEYEYFYDKDFISKY